MAKNFLLLFTLFVFAGINAETIDIEIPDIRFIESDGYVTPEIEGFELDGAGEELVLPFKKLVFGSEVTKIEILKQHKIVTKAPLKKGAPLFRMIDMKRVPVKKFPARKLPSISKFTFNHYSTFKRKQKQFGFRFYPVIPRSDNEIIKIDKIRVHTKGAVLLPQKNTKNGKSLLILTTDYFLNESKEIDNYINAKKSDGFIVDVITEKDYGGGTLKGVDRFKKIREYLRGVYENYDFLLIIANPNPGGDEVPMLVTRPTVTNEPSYDNVPTDIFYGELTEEIDSSGNGVYGEENDNVEYAFELVVGRIPLYYKDVESADKILARTAEFVKGKSETAENRRRILFPTTISYYKNQDGDFGTPKMDGAYVAQYLLENSIKKPFTSKLLVESEGLDPSEFADEEDAITEESVLENFQKGYGVVFWMGHGEASYSVRTVWAYDGNKDGIADLYRGELNSEIFVSTKLIDEVKSELSFVFQGSCLNGSIQDSDNLAYTMLQNTSVGVVGASQVSYGAIYSNYNLAQQDIFAYGTVFTDALVNNKIPAQVLFETKEKWYNYDVLLVDKLETNYLGDPSLTINIRSCSKNSDCDDSLYCNGQEVCTDGFCEKAAGTLPCDNSKNSCEISVCDEATKSCETTAKADGSYCASTENMCFGSRRCMSGECIESDEKDCSHLDSDCSKGECNPKTGECLTTPLNEGKSCKSGLFCVKNEICVEGICQGEEPDLPKAKECNKMECDEFDGFINISDSSQNWESCTTDDGKQGYCSYGNCLEKAKQDSDKSSSSGCSAVIL